MQPAYKEAHSTETALLRVQNDILSTGGQGGGGGQRGWGEEGTRRGEISQLSWI